MPFNGSGTYTLPAGNPVVTGTTISSTTTNSTNSDIATALSNCVTRDGQSTATANLPLGGFKITGLAAGTSNGDSVRYEQIQYLANASSANTWTATQTFSGSSSTFGTSLLDSNETVNVVAAAPSATTNFYIQSGSVQYYTSNAANNWTLNIAFSSGTTLNTALATGQSVTFTLITTQNSTAYYANAITIDGTSVTPKWIGGAPTAGNASGLDVYRFAVVKVGSASYTVLASLTQYK